MKQDVAGSWAQRVFAVTLVVEDLRGVELLRGPEGRPWGPRTASFRDPAGHVWEIAQH